MQYSKLVEVYERLESTTKRLEKTFIISTLLKQTKTEDLPEIILLLRGLVYPPWDEHKLGVASKLVVKAIHTSTGISGAAIEDEWRKIGDLGEVAKKLVAKKRQVTLFSQELSVKKVFSNLKKLASTEGKGAVEKKMQLIAELLTSAKPVEAKYIIRTLLEELRVGVADGTLRDAVTWAYFSDKAEVSYNEKERTINVEDREKYNHYVGEVQAAYDVSNDFGLVAQIAEGKGVAGLKKISMKVGTPIKVMLALKVKDAKEGFERVGKPAECEYKLDGFRMQIHKEGSSIIIYTRRLENVTKQFPDVVEYVKKNVRGKSFIIDSEAVGYSPKTKRYLPFQNISQRIKRKYDIDKMAKDFPVELNIFDIVYYEGKNLIKEDFKKRRVLIERIVNEVPQKIVLVKKLVTSKEKDVEEFYKDSIDKGNEGIMMKKLDAPYKPGARVGYMVKIKPVMDTLDLVIVGAEWGEGKRANWLSSFTLACIDENGEFLEVGKVGTGIKEKEKEGVTFEALTELLKPLIKSQKGRIVEIKPQIVVEVNYEEIQKSPTYSSGYALRFPRLIAVREDRSPEECSTLDMVEDYYYGQKR
jgi:DNA ligase-1